MKQKFTNSTFDTSTSVVIFLNTAKESKAQPPAGWDCPLDRCKK